MNNWTIEKLHKKLAEIGSERHIDSLYKARRNKAVSKDLAKALETITGVARLRWLYPDEYGNPWSDLGLE